MDEKPAVAIDGVVALQRTLDPLETLRQRDPRLVSQLAVGQMVGNSEGVREERVCDRRVRGSGDALRKRPQTRACPYPLAASYPSHRWTRDTSRRVGRRGRMLPLRGVSFSREFRIACGAVPGMGLRHRRGLGTIFILRY